MHNNQARLKKILTAPATDYLDGLKACLSKFKISCLIIIITFFMLSWWGYVPVHEIFHAWGCLIGGGEVSQLDLSPVYGAVFLKNIFPFIHVGSEYAGRLTGFNTHNSDLIYLLTVFFPYIITILIGIPLLMSVKTGRTSLNISCIKFGVALPIAYSPFISITGDYYEIGSIILTRLISFLLPSFQVDRWRSDDLFKLVENLFFSNNSFKSGDVIGVVLSFLLGIILIFATYWTGRLWAKAVIKPT